MGFFVPSNILVLNFNGCLVLLEMCLKDVSLLVDFGDFINHLFLINQPNRTFFLLYVGFEFVLRFYMCISIRLSFSCWKVFYVSCLIVSVFTYWPIHKDY